MTEEAQATRDYEQTRFRGGTVKRAFESLTNDASPAVDFVQ